MGKHSAVNWQVSCMVLSLGNSGVFRAVDRGMGGAGAKEARTMGLRINA
jgi:hypothetical protein